VLYSRRKVYVYQFSPVVIILPAVCYTHQLVSWLKNILLPKVTDNLPLLPQRVFIIPWVPGSHQHLRNMLILSINNSSMKYVFCKLYLTSIILVSASFKKYLPFFSQNVSKRNPFRLKKTSFSMEILFFFYCRKKFLHSIEDFFFCNV
jgi:hypothetical protein